MSLIIQIGQLVDVAKKYGIDANAFEEALLSR